MKKLGMCLNILMSSLLLGSCSSGPNLGPSGTEVPSLSDFTKKTTEQYHISRNGDFSDSSLDFRVKNPTRSLILTDEQFQNITTLDATMANSDQLDFSRKYLERFSASCEINNAMITGKWEEARSDFQTKIVLMLNFWPSMGPDKFVITNVISGDITPTKWRIEGKYQLTNEKLKLEIERINGNLPVWIENKIEKKNRTLGDFEMLLEVTKLPAIYIIGIRFDESILYVDDL